MAAQGIVQYVLVRADLCKTLGWPVGALVAQACHASTAVIHLFYNHEDTQKYLADLDNMHKIVLAVSNLFVYSVEITETYSHARGSRNYFSPSPYLCLK